MKKRAIFAALAALAFAMTASVAVAHSKTEVSGDWTYAPIEFELVAEFGQNTLFRGVSVGEMTGSMTGEEVTNFWLLNLGRAEMNLFGGEAVFTGTIEDADGTLHEGTMTFRSFGKQDPGLITPSDFPWEGRWFVTGGDGGLDGLRGHGTWTGPSLVLTYDGSVHLPH